MSAARRVAVLGLPGTGKSTYLGTLWHLVEEPTVDDISEVSVAGDRMHIQGLAQRVRAMEQVERTQHDANERFDVEVSLPEGTQGRLVIPDRSGEQLQALIERRRWPELLEAEIAEAGALILFVHPNAVRMPLELSIATSVARPREDDQDYENHLAATAAQLVDGLENVLEAMSDRWPVRLAVVVSAFDLLDGWTPEQWLSERLPALAAMLRNNPDRVASTVYGVSAQGGASDEAEEVLSRGALHDRAWARAGDGEAVSVVAPVRWALDS